jgi:hypothetical protein
MAGVGARKNGGSSRDFFETFKFKILKLQRRKTQNVLTGTPSTDLHFEFPPRF